MNHEPSVQGNRLDDLRINRSMATRYEWNARRATAKVAKHGVDFNTAKAIFFDHAALTEIDDSDPAEERWKTIGLAAGKILVVVYTEPDVDGHPHHLGAQSDQARRKSLLWSDSVVGLAIGTRSARTGASGGCRRSLPTGRASMQ